MILNFLYDVYVKTDLMKGLDYALENFDFIDSSRMAALGASYGGYMINWINGHTDRFRCLGMFVWGGEIFEES
jgi:dipeptidyl aminopeptidase/acylaminoacyl peptidase